MNLTVGTTATQTYTITRELITSFNASVGYQPQTGGTEQRLVARSMLAATLLTRTLEEEITQEHTFLTQSFKFRGAIHEGDVIAATLTVASVEAGMVSLRFAVTNQDEEQVMLGEVTLQLIGDA